MHISLQIVNFQDLILWAFQMKYTLILSSLVK